MKRWCSWILLLALLVVPAVRADAEGSAVLALGADLSASQRATVLSEMGITEAEAAAYETIYITNYMEHQYLD